MDLEAIRARAAAATGGPWVPYFNSHGDPYVTLPGLYLTRRIADVSVSPDDYGKANAEFIAHAREDVPDLLAEVARLTEELDAAHANNRIYYESCRAAEAARDSLRTALAEILHATETTYRIARAALAGPTEGETTP